jgi:hypothetical protein
MRPLQSMSVEMAEVPKDKAIVASQEFLAETTIENRKLTKLREDQIAQIEACLPLRVWEFER